MSENNALALVALLPQVKLEQRVIGRIIQVVKIMDTILIVVRVI